MSLRVLCKDQPRTLAVVTNDHALVLKHTPPSSDSVPNDSYSNVSSARCVVEFSSLSSVDLSEYRPLGSGHGTLGLVTLGADVFLCLVTSASKVAALRPGETVLKILSVDFYCLNRAHYDAILDYESRTGYDFTQGDDAGDDYGPPGYEGRELAAESPFVALKKLLSDGSFYYSTDFNLTNRIQDRADDAVAFDIDNLDDGFLWNSHMISPLLQFRSRLAEQERQTLDSARILTSVIRGFVSSLTIPASTALLRHAASNLPSTLTLVSRLSSRRAGTRFNSRGIDDDGNVANFVETETVLWMPHGLCVSYTQVRGSVPIFWEQAPGLIPGQQKIQITRSPQATQPAFDKHFENLETDYGAVHVVNLLSELRTGEVEISERFRNHILRSPLQNSDHRLLRYTDFDFHAETRGAIGYEGADVLRKKIDDSAEAFAYFLSEQSPTHSSGGGGRVSEKPHDVRNMPTVVLHQEGVFRTNCLDCLDRTNLVQTLISRMALESFLQQQHGSAPPDFWTRHSTLWADNGDNLSKIYAGTGALKSSFTRHGKMSLAGAIADARKSATRLYVNNFTDNERQNTIDVLLGTLTGQSAVHLHDPISDFVNAELKRRAVEYTSSKKIRIWAGTFNVNGRRHGASEDLSPWLLGHLRQSEEDPALVAVGFQEIVELSPQQIMSTDPASRGVWEEAVRETLNEYAAESATGEYVLLRSGQLVGAALLLFAKEEVLSDIKNVEGSVKKTGMSGMAGNKGGSAIRLEYANTRICFVTAHLAAGFSNYEERNNDYNTISSGLRFQRNRAISDHDSIIWMGDFNYRIGSTNEYVRGLIKKGDLETLYDHDQLNLQMVAGIAFPYYSEGRVLFQPTYRYDNGTDTYDTSEKARVPAWCDRILWKGSNLHQLQYNTAPLKFSDHRPVYAVFECVISTINKQLQNKLRDEIYQRHKASVGNVAEHSVLDETDDEETIGYDSIDPGLPPASSDRRKWWLDHGQLAQANIKQQPGTTLNPRRNPNPFPRGSGSSESDWVHVSHLDTRESGDETSNRPAAGRGQKQQNKQAKPAPPPPPPSRPVQPTGRQLLDLEIAGNETGGLTPPLTPSKHKGSSDAPAPAPAAATAVVAPRDPTKKVPPPIPKKPASLSQKRTPVDLLSGGTEGLDSSIDSGFGSGSGSGSTSTHMSKPTTLPTREAAGPTTSSETPASTITRRGGNIPASTGPVSAPRHAPAAAAAPVAAAAAARAGQLRPLDKQPTTGPATLSATGGPVPGGRRPHEKTKEDPDLATLSRSMSSFSARGSRRGGGGSGASPSVAARAGKDKKEGENRDMLMDDDDGGDGLLGWQALKPG